MLPLRHPNKKETFGQELQRRRLEQKCSVAKQAKELNVSKELYRAWEADKAVPETVPFKRMICWCKALSDWSELVRKARSAGYGDLPKPEKKSNGHDKELQELMEREQIEVTLLTIPGALRWSRIDEGLSVEELAALMGLDRDVIYRWESEGPKTMDELHMLMDVFPDLAVTLDENFEGLQNVDSYALVNGELGWLGDGNIVLEPKEVEEMADPQYNVKKHDDPSIGWARAVVDVASSPDRKRFVALLDYATKDEVPKQALIKALELCDSDQVKQFLSMLLYSIALKLDLKTLANTIRGGE